MTAHILKLLKKTIDWNNQTAVYQSIRRGIDLILELCENAETACVRVLGINIIGKVAASSNSNVQSSNNSSSSSSNSNSRNYTITDCSTVSSSSNRFLSKSIFSTEDKIREIICSEKTIRSILQVLITWHYFAN